MSVSVGVSVWAMGVVETAQYLLREKYVRQHSSLTSTGVCVCCVSLSLSLSLLEPMELISETS